LTCASGEDHARAFRAAQGCCPRRTIHPRFPVNRVRKLASFRSTRARGGVAEEIRINPEDQLVLADLVLGRKLRRDPASAQWVLTEGWRQWRRRKPPSLILRPNPTLHPTGAADRLRSVSRHCVRPRQGSLVVARVGCNEPGPSLEVIWTEEHMVRCWWRSRGPGIRGSDRPWALAKPRCWRPLPESLRLKARGNGAGRCGDRPLDRRRAPWSAGRDLRPAPASGD
jgi:hypothetical protein